MACSSALRAGRALLVLAACATTAATPLPRTVLVARDASAVERFAAGELLAFLGNLTGEASLSHAGGPGIAVGWGAATQLGMPAARLSGLDNDSFVLSNLPNGSFGIAGRPGAARGPLYGVYEFLRALGCRFYSWDQSMQEMLPASPPPGLPVLNKTVRPQFEYRDNNEWSAGAHPLWAGRLGYNGPSAHPAAGDRVSYAGGFVHTSYSLLGADPAHPTSPPAELWREHREWFWPRADTDNATYGQLCFHNQSLVRYLTERVRMTLRANPDATIISVSQNDNYLYCNDTAEQAIMAAEGTPGGALFRAVNTIAESIADEFPHVAVDTLAYQWSRPAPKLTKPRPNVIVRLCSIECNFAAPFTDPSNAPFAQDMSNWAAISNRTYIWNYITNFQNYIMPFPNYYVLGPNIKFLKEHGVRGIFEEGAYSTPGGDMDALKGYITGRMLWDPTLDSTGLISGFLAGYYGPLAAPLVREYMDIMHGAVADSNVYMGESFDQHKQFLTPVALHTAASAYRSAVKLTAGVYRSRIDVAKLPVYYTILLRWDEIVQFGEKERLDWPLEPTKQAAWEEFARVATLINVTKVNERGCDLACAYKLVFNTTATIAA